MLDVRKAVIGRLKPVLDFTYYWYAPTMPVAPAVLVMPDHPPVDYQQAFSSNTAEYRLVLTLIVDRIDEETAQEQLSELLAPTGPIVGALHDDDQADSLSKLTRYVQVTSAGSFSEMTMGGVTYYYAQLRVSVKA